MVLPAVDPPVKRPRGWDWVEIAAPDGDSVRGIRRGTKDEPGFRGTVFGFMGAGEGNAGLAIALMVTGGRYVRSGVSIAAAS